MKENIKLILKGFVVGLGKIIPGVSGAMLAITMGIYEKGLRVISNIFKEFKQHFQFLLYLGIGIVFALIIGGKIVMYCLDNFYLPTMLLFIGMIIGGIKPLFKEIKGKPVQTKNLIISFAVVTVLLIVSLLDFGQDKSSYVKGISSFLIFFLGGILDAAATVIPGISGTALLMILGYYNIIMSTFGDILNINHLGDNMFVLVPFALGMVCGIFFISKIINYLFSHYKTTTYYAIIGFACVSVLILIGKTFGNVYSIVEIIISLILLVTGYFISKKLDA
ncbi:MAG: DUF368 domain-containing protein [Firmicutes bacterium]|nr:DUF368 domain-containing protein [Bacillota bacterium]